MPIQDLSQPMLNVFGNGPATGYQVAGQVQQTNQANDLANQGASLNNDLNSQKLQSSILDEPVAAVQRQADMATLNDKIDQLKQGLPQQQIQADLAQKKATTAATNLSIEDKKRLAVGSVAQQMDETLGDQVTIPLAQQQAYRQKWKQVTGTDLPTDPAEARSLIKTYGDWQRNDGANLMKKAEMKSKETIANTRADAYRDVADTNYDKSIATQQMITERTMSAAQLKTAASLGTAGIKTYNDHLRDLEAKGQLNPTQRAQLDYANALDAAKAKQSTGAQISSVKEGTPSAAEKVIDDYNSPKGSTPATQPTAKPAQETKQIGKDTYIKIDGQWYKQ